MRNRCGGTCCRGCGEVGESRNNDVLFAFLAQAQRGSVGPVLRRPQAALPFIRLQVVPPHCCQGAIHRKIGHLSGQINRSRHSRLAQARDLRLPGCLMGIGDLGRQRRYPSKLVHLLTMERFVRNRRRRRALKRSPLPCSICPLLRRCDLPEWQGGDRAHLALEQQQCLFEDCDSRFKGQG